MRYSVWSCLPRRDRHPSVMEICLTQLSYSQTMQVVHNIRWGLAEL